MDLNYYMKGAYEIVENTFVNEICFFEEVTQIDILK